MDTFIDISVLVSPATPEWPGDTPFSCGWTWDMAQGASVNVSSLTMSPHVGTHADAPVHVQNATSDSALGAHQLPVQVFMGPTVVADVSDLRGDIDLETLMSRLPAEEGNTSTPSIPIQRPVPTRLLLKTGRTIADERFPAEWPALAPACAQTLAQGGLMLLGVDCPSVDDRESKTLAVHHALFDNGAYILENLDLRHVPPGTYDLVAPPLKLEGLDAAPVRAILLRR